MPIKCHLRPILVRGLRRSLGAAALPKKAALTPMHWCYSYSYSHPGSGKVVLGQQRRDDDGGAPGFSGRNRSNTGGLEAALTKGTSREEHCVELV